MANGYHLITGFQGWARLRTDHCLWSLSASDSKLLPTQLPQSLALGTTQEISSQGWAPKGTNVYSVPTTYQTWQGS